MVLQHAKLFATGEALRHRELRLELRASLWEQWEKAWRAADNAIAQEWGNDKTYRREWDQ
jgi:hypothetical protein